MNAVSDADGYTVEVVAHTPFGDFTGDSWNFDIVDGSLVATPVIDPVPVVDPSPIVVDPSTVTVTPIDGGAGGWTVSWPELASAPTDGDYVVTTDQGDSCTAEPTGVAGTILSCTLAARADGSTDLSGVVVTFEQLLFFNASATARGHGSPTNTSDPTSPTVTPVVLTTTRAPGSTTKSLATSPTAHALSATPKVSSSDAPQLLLGGGLIVMLLAALAVWLRRRRVL
jgi:hypothetical protein